MIKWLSLLIVAGVIGLAAQCTGETASPATPALPIPPAGSMAHLALLTPTSDELATFGRTLRNGSLMAIDTWNSRGGVLGQPVQWGDYDTPCDFEAAQQTVQQALDDGLKFLVGPLCSEAAIAAALIAQAGEAVLIAPSATHPLVTADSQGQPRPTIFRASYGYARQGQAVAAFAYTHLSVRRAAILFASGDDYGAALAEAFASQFEAQGGEIVLRMAYQSGDSDFKPLLQTIVQAKAEALYLPASASQVSRLAAQWRELDLSKQITWLGSDSWESPQLDKAAAEGSFFSVHFVEEDGRPETRAWVEAYKAKYAVSPTTLAALGYTATDTLLTAIQQAGAVKVTEVASTLARGEFEDITGRFTFDAQHNPLKPVPVVQLKAGKLVLATYITLP